MIRQTFFVHGTPAPGGSKNFFPVWDKKTGKCKTHWKNGREWPIILVVDDAGERNKKWREDVAIQARGFMRGGKPFNVPMKIEYVFFIRRPKIHFRTGKFSHLLKDDAPAEHDQAPDALKLARSTEDALTGIIYVDDARTMRIASEKRWCAPEEKSGCAITFILLPGQRETSAPPDSLLQDDTLSLPGL